MSPPSGVKRVNLDNDITVTVSALLTIFTSKCAANQISIYLKNMTSDVYSL